MWWIKLVQGQNFQITNLGKIDLNGIDLNGIDLNGIDLNGIIAQRDSVDLTPQMKILNEYRAITPER